MTKIVIEIPDMVHEAAVLHGTLPIGEDDLCKIIAEGTPLKDIRAEIEQAKTVEIKPDNGNTFKASVNYVINPQYRNFTSGLDIALQIIDKHMGKGEQDADN